MASNVQTQQFFTPQKKELSADSFGGFDQTDKALSYSTMMRNHALSKIKELQEKRMEEQRKQEEMNASGGEGDSFELSADPNKDWATKFIEAGRQRVVDTAGSPEAFNRMMKSMGDKASGVVQNASEGLSRAVQGTMVGGKAIMGTQFGVRQGADIYSKGINTGTDIIVPRGTPVAAPPIGEWEVVSAFDRASKEGPKNSQRGINNGYGNSVMIKNTKTGEQLRYSHLMVGGVGVREGQVIKGGTQIGKSGASGNTDGRTGQHLDLEYRDSTGRLRNVFGSQYGRYLQ